MLPLRRLLPDLPAGQGPRRRTPPQDRLEGPDRAVPAPALGPGHLPKGPSGGHGRGGRHGALGLRSEEARDPGGDRIAARGAAGPRADGGDHPRGTDRGRRVALRRIAARPRGGDAVHVVLPGRARSQVARPARPGAYRFGRDALPGLHDQEDAAPERPAGRQHCPHGGPFLHGELHLRREDPPALEKRLPVKLGQIRKLNIKDDIVVTTAKKETVHIPFSVMDEFARPACFACTDFANEYADLSCGGIGSPDGYTSLVLRTTAGEALYNRAKEDGAIEELRFRSPDDRRNAGTEMMAKIVAATRRKQARAEKTETVHR